MKKYIVCGGTVFSKDGDFHTISPEKVIELYGVNPSDCIIVHNPKDELGIDVFGKTILWPRNDGKYEKKGGKR